MTPEDLPPREAESAGGAGAAGGAPDPLDALRDRVRRTQDAVERLADEAAAPGGDATGRPPRNGYGVPGEGDPASEAGREAQALVALLDLVRALVPRELQEQLSALVRELLLLVKALIDWYVDRMDRRRRPAVEVQDIPIT
jgi:hypothetical protein